MKGLPALAFILLAAAPAAQPAREPASRLAEADTALAAGDLDRALSLATAHLARRPASAAARIIVARVHLERGALDAAYRALDRAARDAPRNIDVQYYLAQVSAQLAAEQFERLVGQTPVSARGHQLLAEGFEARERRSDAEREYEAALAANPDLLEALLGLARLKRLRLDCDAALALYARAERVRPTFEAAYGTGSCRLRQHEYATARDALTTAVARDPTSTVARVGLASALLGLGRPAEAIPQLERAIALDPAMDDAWFVLGRAAAAAGQPDDAKRAFAMVEQLRREGRR